jgi:Rod binding domain-containing protein
MDSSGLILTEPVLPPASLQLDTQYQVLDTHRASSIENRESREQIAKDFESLLLHKLLEEMKNTIGDWGFSKDGVSKQMQGIFWLQLAQDIADKGGLGLWKNIYEFLTHTEQSKEKIDLLNENI